MRATIRDPEVLAGIRPGDLAAYLRAKGWQQQHYSAGRSIWTLGANGDSFEILLPLDDSFRDYALRIGDVLRTLERAEDRSQLEVVADVATAFADTVRVAACNGRQRGSIGIGDGIELASSAREMMLAAACAAEKPRRQYPSRKSDKATKYASTLELGQTERGSYVLTVLSPIPSTAQRLLFDDSKLAEPFERRVTRTLSSALSTTIEAAEKTMASGKIAPFKEAVALGVSSNLCEALVGLHRAAGGHRLGLGISWASAFPTNEPLSAPVQIRPETAEVIAEAARVLGPREEESKEEFRLVGIVTALRREKEAETGKVTVAGAIEGDMRKVTFELQREDYHRAVTAHDSRSLIQCTGELTRKVTGSLALENPRSFTVVE